MYIPIYIVLYLEIACTLIRTVHYTLYTCTYIVYITCTVCIDSISCTQDEQQHEQQQHQRRAQDEWMLICQRAADLQPDTSSQEDFNWTVAAQSYSNLEEAPTFITRNRQQAAPRTFTTSASPGNLQGWQLKVYTTAKDHFESDNPPPLRMIVTGTAGTGKSYLIHCIRLLLGDKLTVAAPTGVASFIIEGTTLHTLLQLPTRGEFKQLEGNRLQQLQQAMTTIKYLIINEMSMVGRKVFGQIDSRLRQAFPTMLKRCLVAAQCYCLGTLASYHQSWTCPSTHLTPAPSSQIR